MPKTIEFRNSDVRKSKRIAETTHEIIKAKSVRRSIRDPAKAMLQRTDVKYMLQKIRRNRKQTVVFKMKDHINSDINSVVVDATIDALYKNTVCQALYIQNLSKAVKNEQLFRLLKLLESKQIWCLNIGENYEISTDGWEQMCKRLPYTSITHLYVSEHIISLDLKNKMRFYIRQNRKKHDLHCNFKNLSVIERCTNMWWNPINGIKELKPILETHTTQRSIIPIELTPAHTAYWQEGVGAGGEKAWKFKCVCGESCSSYENFRYHPVGRMFECSRCSIWSHVSCVLGSHVSDDDLEEMEGVLCAGCKARVRRLGKLSEEKRALFEKSVLSSSQVNKNNETIEYNNIKEVVEEKEEEWSFKCSCGESCSSVEDTFNYPAGEWFQCTHCDIWAHVECVFGSGQSAESVAVLEVAHCDLCRTKNRRCALLDKNLNFLASTVGEHQQPVSLCVSSVEKEIVDKIVSTIENDNYEANKSIQSFLEVEKTVLNNYGNNNKKFPLPVALTVNEKKDKVIKIVGKEDEIDFRRPRIEVQDQSMVAA